MKAKKLLFIGEAGSGRRTVVRSLMQIVNSNKFLDLSLNLIIATNPLDESKPYHVQNYKKTMQGKIEEMMLTKPCEFWIYHIAGNEALPLAKWQIHFYETKHLDERLTDDGNLLELEPPFQTVFVYNLSTLGSFDEYPYQRAESHLRYEIGAFPIHVFTQTDKCLQEDAVKAIDACKDIKTHDVLYHSICAQAFDPTWGLKPTKSYSDRIKACCFQPFGERTTRKISELIATEDDRHDWLQIRAERNQPNPICPTFTRRVSVAPNMVLFGKTKTKTLGSIYLLDLLLAQ